MGQRMANPPVYFALAYVGFDPVLAMSKYIPDIQEKFRKSGFTTYREDSTSKITVSDGDGASREAVTMVKESLWFLGTKDTQTYAIIAEDGITFQTSKYTDHEEFFEKAVSAFDIVESIVSLNNITQLALRYFNAVLPEAEETTGQYLNSQEPKLINWDEDAIKHFVTNSYSVFQTRMFSPDGEELHGRLGVGTNWFNSITSLPPDIISADMKFEERFRVEHPVKHVVVDLQHGVDTVFPAENKKIKAIFNELHAGLNSSFRFVFSDFAWERWS